MFAVALLTIGLLALANARIYERCELARDLLSLGVRREQLATWVCIAFHESRFDTAARNPHSGDHGLFQISELYWCGVGKACGLPCSALRDEDISDDFECALQVHEEHTRLQGNGFLAWVVYPHHCKSNAKKYLADCESSVKTPLVKTDGSARVLKSQSRNVTAFSYNPKIDDLSPPFLTIGSFLRSSYKKGFEQNYDKDKGIDWLNYKIDNIDDLKLPGFSQKVTEGYPTKTIPSPNSISNPKIDELLPPYLTIGSFLRGSYKKEFEQNYDKDKRIDWLNYKIDNIDDLKLPGFSQKVTEEYSSKTISSPNSISTPSPKTITPYFRRTFSPTYTTTSTTVSPLPNIKPPSPRRIESNSFRRRKLRPIEESNKFIETTQYVLNSTTLLLTTVAPSNTYKSTTEHTLMKDNSLKSPVTTVVPVTTPTTNKNKYTSNHELSSPITLAQSSAVTKSPLDYITNLISTVDQNVSMKTTERSSVSTPGIKHELTMALRNRSLSIDKSLKSESIADSKRKMPVNKSHADEATSTLSSLSIAPFSITKQFNFEHNASHSTTIKPWSKSWFSWRTTPSSLNKSTMTSTTSAPTSPSLTTSKSRWGTTPIALTTYKPPLISWSVAKSFLDSTSLDKTTSPTTTSKPSQITWNTPKPWAKITPSQQTIFTSTTAKPSSMSWSAKKPLSSTTSSYTTSTTSKPRPWSAVNSWLSVTPPSQTTFTLTTSKPSPVTWGAWKSWTSTTPSYKTKITSTTSRPTSTTSRTVKSWSSTNEQLNEKISSRPKNQSMTSIPWIKNRIWTQNTSQQPRELPHTELLSNNNNSSTRSFLTASTANTPKRTTRVVTSTEIHSPTTARTTQSIFDLYLNPTKRPNLSSLSAPLFKNRGFGIRIFADGTTTHAPNFLRSENPKIATEIKKETKSRTLK